jgi:ribosomal protein L7/L12
MVESAPVWLKKDVAKEDAESLAEKLKALGAEVRIV